MNTKPALELLESRLVPGGMLDYGVTDSATAVLLAEAAGSMQRLSPDDQVAVPIAQRTPIELPQADLVLISSSVNGQPSRYLDVAHDAFPPGIPQPQDVGSVDAVIAEIQAAYAKAGRPVDITIVATSTQDQQTGIIIGKSYLFPNSKDTQTLLSAVNGQVASITFLVSNGTAKAPLYQQLAWSLSAGNPVDVNGYTGFVGVVDGTPGWFYTTGHPVGYHSM